MPCHKSEYPCPNCRDVKMEKVDYHNRFVCLNCGKSFKLSEKKYQEYRWNHGDKRNGKYKLIQRMVLRDGVMHPK